MGLSNDLRPPAEGPLNVRTCVAEKGHQKCTVLQLAWNLMIKTITKSGRLVAIHVMGVLKCDFVLFYIQSNP